MSLDSFCVQKKLNIKGCSYNYFSIKDASKKLGLNYKKLPVITKIFFENLLRNEDGYNVTCDEIKLLPELLNSSNGEISFMPARILMQDFTGVPAVVDLAAMRDYVKKNGKDPNIINPKTYVDLVIDHSLQVDFYGSKDSVVKNTDIEMYRNMERYQFLKWGKAAFSNFRVVPPGVGICHQVNLEYLAKVVWNDGIHVYPDTVVGTDSHTTMINGLAVLGWGVGGIEAEAVMLGQPITMQIPRVIGFKLVGKLSEGITATDMVLTITNILREKGVVGKFIEFYGDGLKTLSVFDRATIANMSPEYGATCGFFPIDQNTLDYLDITGRDSVLIDLVEAYAKEQGLWCDYCNEILYSDNIEFDLSEVQAVVAGPKRPQDKVLISQVSKTLYDFNIQNIDDTKSLMKHGDVVIAAITSCTNTSNPSVMIAAGLVARKANKLGIKSKPWVKTSLAPGSQVVMEYLKVSNLQDDLDVLGFNVVGYGCTTCIGNSGPLAENIEQDIKNNNIVVTAVLSGNRNFEGRIHAIVRANYLASPPLVVVYAIAGTVNIDITKDPICQDELGRDVYLKDIWPSNQEISDIISKFISKEMFIEKYSSVFEGGKLWENIDSMDEEMTYKWDSNSTYIQNPPYFDNLSVNNFTKSKELDIRNARVLMLLGDNITTDHISPAGNIPRDSAAGRFLMRNNVQIQDFNSYGSRRGNHCVMIRGTFANIRIKNEMLDGIEGGFTLHVPTNQKMTIFDASVLYQQEKIPLVIIAGKDYGSGSSRDWAAKGTFLLGVKAIIAESFERIHRSNLIGMGVLPLTFKDGQTRKSLQLCGDEIISITGTVGIQQDVDCCIVRKNNVKETIRLRCQLNTISEVDYFVAGGVMQYMLLKMIKREGVYKERHTLKNDN
ncbi:aconitate hydratase AcnA [Neoehrlichia mikurensis]|uniref:Aconitate hydratase n=1 Tax=Neoehrlichia mikurensis TaxID=89586 RepID=A0A9Q9F445_9RICK|nr:aconitate hydratase AcnA [Neoehrlichia mikurensis]QXK91654.1 aconitate hydratase AcnA [Neoehrlichia mikurensis]QXK92865.1 aconitate hydratase AcnA [Neoehrlichia mikurensis]QXK93345.1 aconitate hydratase AcnA [Neoehrlichia mikurensis]UTO55712.1 aconitate hydratase AcnA [Neoehrlichia mikurensis]UTO56629.1 aconitate hydratase AcnA [Neoehrlichia mikurensis]